MRRDPVFALAAIALVVTELVVGTALDQLDGVSGRHLRRRRGHGASVGLARTHPRAAWIVALGGYLPVGLTVDADTFVPYFVLWYQAFNAGRRDGGRLSFLAGAGVFAVCEADSLITSTDAAMFSFLAPAIWLAGRAMRDREQVADRLAERARELEAEREAYARLSVRYERARIDADLTAETFEAIAESARQAEQDMARLVALLGDGEAIGPAPDLALVEELVGRAAGSGLDVTLRLEGEREGLPAPVVEAAYRVVQESLTNALRYASGAPVHVDVRGEREDVVVEVANGPAGADVALAGAGTGNGLRGLRERVGAARRSLDAGPTGDGGWHVGARLPRRAAVGAQGETSERAATVLRTL